ncbi:MAG: hypothetical protein FRX48_03923 [Lasallia pustulata]|uniref:Uncharacterized protein n=1 Tax=Lasallia pustulata TaxID=136370 RepID=A0A1W5D940_9LECA|nr:MAG: hypothetical protein FRX48_03923 [Lasallia pustulata]SLM39510.1 hypothetical protein LPUS_10069 [Lasallia pustulata]
MPEVTQPKPTHQMAIPDTTSAPRISSEQPRPQEPMTMSMRGGGEGEEICCGCCAACCACEAFECFECCKGICD